MSDEKAMEKVNELVYAYELYEKKLNEMVVFKEKLEKNIKEYDVIIHAIDALEETSKDVILPISKMAFVRAKDVDTSNVLVSVGAGVVVEMPLAKAKKYVENLKDKVSKEIEKIDAHIDALANEMSKVQEELKKYGLI